MERRTEWLSSLWLEVFNDLLNDELEEEYGDEWTLNFNYSQTDTLTWEEQQRGWKIFCQTARGEFQCASCKKTWPSARVTVLFRYRLQGNRGRGTVTMRPFGQCCRSCDNNVFELCGFARTEVDFVLRRLFSKIRKNCYNDADDADGSSACTPKVWTKPHESSLCEACSMGICCQKD